MSVTIVYKRETDYGAETESFLNDLEKKVGEGQVEILDPETIDGEMFARTHDLTSYPAIVATDGEGRVVQSWVGLPLPRVDDVSYFVNL